MKSRGHSPSRLALHWLHVEHLVRPAEAVALVQRFAGIRRMERDYPNLLFARLSQGLIDQLAGQLLSPMLRLNIKVQQVAALILPRIQRVWRPVQDDQARAGNHLAAFGGQPAEIPSIRQPGFHPRFKVLRHYIKDPVILPPRVHKHAAPVVGDDGRVCRRRCSNLVHARSIAF